MKYKKSRNGNLVMMGPRQAGVVVAGSFRRPALVWQEETANLPGEGASEWKQTRKKRRGDGRECQARRLGGRTGGEERRRETTAGGWDAHRKQRTNWARLGLAGALSQRSAPGPWSCYFSHFGYFGRRFAGAEVLPLGQTAYMYILRTM